MWGFAYPAEKNKPGKMRHSLLQEPPRCLATHCLSRGLGDVYKRQLKLKSRGLTRSWGWEPPRIVTLRGA